MVTLLYVLVSPCCINDILLAGPNKADPIVCLTLAVNTMMTNQDSTLNVQVLSLLLLLLA